MEDTKDNAPSITIEQIEQALTSNPELESVLVQKALQTESGKTWLNNHTSVTKSTLEKEYTGKISEATKNAYNNIDEQIKALGYEVPKGEMTSKVYGSLLKKLHEKASSNDTTKLEQSLRDEYEGQLNDYKSKYEELVQTNRTRTIKDDLLSSDLAFNDTYSKEVKQTLLSAAIAQMSANAKIDENGKVIYYKDDGTPIVDATTGTYKTGSKLIEEHFTKMGVLQGEKAKGGGASKEAATTNKVKGVVTFDTTGVRTKMEWQAKHNEAAKRQGILHGTDDFNNSWDAHKVNEIYKSLPER